MASKHDLTQLPIDADTTIACACVLLLNYCMQQSDAWTVRDHTELGNALFKCCYMQIVLVPAYAGSFKLWAL
eukprot:8039-Heterococcus_DN1.PRE.2